MKILHKGENGRWEQIPSEPYTNEAELQDLIADDASVLPFDDIGYEEKFITIGKEVGLHGNSLDLLAISPKGHIAVIETKLTRNPEIRREVVGQVLSYAASLWKMQYADIERYFNKFLLSQRIDYDGSLFEYVKEKCQVHDISENEFREGIEKRLELGSFSLLIVVDALSEINNELVNIANYLNDRTGQEIDFYVVEVERIGDHAGSYLLPKLANPPQKNVTASDAAKSTRSDKYDRKPLTQDEFLERLNEDEKRIAKMFIDLAKRTNHIGISWRKTGFSIWTMIPREISDGIYDYEAGYPYFFFQTSEKNGEYYKALSFWYPENSYLNLPKLQKIVQPYRDLYSGDRNYNSAKKEIKLEKVENTLVEKLVARILQTAKELSKLDEKSKYDKAYKD